MNLEVYATYVYAIHLWFAWVLLHLEVLDACAVSAGCVLHDTHWILAHGTQWCICMRVWDQCGRRSLETACRNTRHKHVSLFQVPGIFCDHLYCSFNRSSRYLRKVKVLFFISSIKAITKEQLSFILWCHATLQASVFHLVWNANGKQEAKPHRVTWPDRPSVIGWQWNGRLSRHWQWKQPPH